MIKERILYLSFFSLKCMKKFEYKIIRLDRTFMDMKVMEEQINILGQNGWELVSVIEKEHYTECYFKQEIISS